MPHRTGARPVVLAALALIAGAAPAAASGAMPAPLAGSEWTPTAIDGTALPEDMQVFLQFRGEGRLQGHGGCNSLAGSYSAAGGRLSLGPLATTRKSCAPPVDAAERRLLAALERARGYRRERIRLTLLDAAGRPVMQLRQTDPD